MVSRPTQYLIRFDDVCPTMSRKRYERFLSIVARYGVHPILAVVPDNHDPDLNIDKPDPRFWDRMRALEAEGATIAMHGYRHLCESSGESLLGLHEVTEFAGIEETAQREWIRAGLKILRDNALHPRLFVAPRHGFDRATLRVLLREGLGVLSDGFANRPFTRGGVVWIPQQLWKPVRRETGLWTICIHPNTAPQSLEWTLERFLEEFSHQFTTFDRVLVEYDPQPFGWAEWVDERIASCRIRLSAARRKLLAV